MLYVDLKVMQFFDLSLKIITRILDLVVAINLILRRDHLIIILAKVFIDGLTVFIMINYLLR